MGRSTNLNIDYIQGNLSFKNHHTALSRRPNFHFESKVVRVNLLFSQLRGRRPTVLNKISRHLQK